MSHLIMQWVSVQHSLFIRKFLPALIGENTYTADVHVFLTVLYF